MVPQADTGGLFDSAIALPPAQAQAFSARLWPLGSVKTIFLLLCALFAQTLQANEPDLKVSEGFVVIRAVGAGKVHFPMFATLDDRGRLYVSESSGSDLYEALRKQTRDCRISLLQDEDADGLYDKSSVFADALVCPMGLAWRDGKLYAADPPDLITLEDTDGDGRADKRTVILSGFGHTDNGSLHGLVFGPDRWLYLTIGQPDGYKLKRPDGSFLEGKSGALLRCKPDGSDVEVVCRGFENLVEIAFMPSGEIIGTDNWFSMPADGVRDALVHLLDGGLYPLQTRDVGTPQLISGEPLPAIAQYPAVAFSGLMRYSGAQFPPTFRGTLLSAQFNTRKIVRHTFARHGASFTTTDEDFVATLDPDFHPSDVLEDSDGSVLIVDTGSWYVHHCPTGRIRKVPAEGGIYRVRHNGTNAIPAPTPSPVWTLAKARQWLQSTNADTLALAARALARLKDRDSVDQLEKLLSHQTAHVRCAAAEALTHCGRHQSVPLLFEALARHPDRFEEHALINALHCLSNAADLTDALERSHPQIQRAAMLLLDQPPHQRLQSLDVIRRLFGDDRLSQTASFILKRHPEWIDELATALKQRLPAGDPRIADVLLSVASLPGIAGLASEAIAGKFPGVSESVRVQLLDSLTKPFSSGHEAIKAAFRGSRGIRAAAVRAVNRLRIPGFESEMRELANDSANAASVRIDALKTVVRHDGALRDQEFAFLVSASTNSPAIRLAIADVLALAKLNASQLAEVLRQDTVPLSTLIAAWKGDLQTLEQAAPEEFRSRIQQLRSQTNSAADTLPSLTLLAQGGDPNRGHELFLGKANCIACHRIGKQGGRVGPDLAKIGAIRSGRDLVEAVVTPSAAFSQGYESYRVTLKSGEDFTGVRVRDTDAALLFRDGSGGEISFNESEVAAIDPTKVSLMPEGLLSGLSQDEIRDLLAYLQSLR